MSDIDSGTYMITSAHGRGSNVLSIDDKEKYAVASSTSSQTWVLELAPDGSYCTLADYRAPGKVLDLSVSSTAPGTQVLVDEKTGNKNQQLEVRAVDEKDGRRRYMIRYHPNSQTRTVGVEGKGDYMDCRVAILNKRVDRQLWYFDSQ